MQQNLIAIEIIAMWYICIGETEMGYNQSKPLQSKKEIFSDLLQKMNLTDKYPQKLSLRDAMTVRQETLGTLHTTDQLTVLPYLILQKMMMCDQRCRSCLFKMLPSKPTADSTSDSDIESCSLHPVDCMLIILHCCDDILRQDLISKLSLCQLAIPFLLPNPTDNSITFLLWAMHSLFRGWKCHETGAKEHRIVDYQGPIVSFLRIGDSSSSKSEILNAVIGGESKFFFNHRECEGGDCERNLVDGLVEMCCYLPSGKDTDPFTDAVVFLNLRGDAQQHPKQVQFIQKISFISVVLIAKENINKKTIKTLQNLSEAPRGIILLLAEGKMMNHKEGYNHITEMLHLALPKDKCSKIKLKGKNIPTLSGNIQQVLVKKLKATRFPTPRHFKALSDCCKFAREAGIYVDEDNEDIINGKWYAKMVMDKVHSVHFSKVKHEMLPLQGPSLWHQWAEYDKEQHRHVKRKKTTTITEYARQKDKEKMKVKKNLFSKCTELTPLMDCFMECLLEKNVNVRQYFLQWLKLFLDDESRKVLSKLLTEYQTIKDELNVARQKYYAEEDSQVRQLKEKLKIQSEELVNASFGLEHLFREMGQIYEARIDSGGYEVPQTLKDKADHLPQIMAEIMDEGHALELMDGDASHVPTLWVLSVIEKLKAVCGKNAREKNGGKIFVLSVLGIQSTGKSTLLNTMFGLHFNVSAGRCTRGAYIQLLPLNNSLRQIIDCDYVLVVDTEGLRAPELQLEGLKHDNELATFVIGLADATIVSIFGETPGDLDDILQTSLHAFIRMRMVDMNPSCLFVHQNVSDVLARDKNVLGRQKFYDKLNNMIQAVAKVENCEGQYNSFNQVICFDESKDVFYFPSLWKGDPPMAPVNIGYSKSAQTLKTALIELIHKKQTCHFSLDAFKLRVKSLWDAVLQENFVFSFKNTLEVCAYNELDSQYAQWSWALQSKMLEWDNTTEWKISNCNSKTEVTEAADLCVKEAKEMLFKTYKDILEEMQSFLNINNYSEILSQWKHKTEQRTRELYEESKKLAEMICDRVQKSKLNSVVIETLQENNFAEFNACIEEMAHKLWEEDRQLSDDKLDQTFEVKWKKLLDNFESKNLHSVIYPSDYEMETHIIKTLEELLHAYSSLIIRNLSNKCFSQINHSLKFSIDKEVHLNPTKWCTFTSITDVDIQLAAKFTEDYLIKSREYLDEIRDESKHFNPSFVYAVLQNLFVSVDEITRPEIKSNFVFTPEYKVDIGLVVCAYALDVFKEITKKHKQENDPTSVLSREKDFFLTKFKNVYKSTK